MPAVDFDPTMPVLEQANTFHALDHVATVIGSNMYNSARLLREL